MSSTDTTIDDLASEGPPHVIEHEYDAVTPPSIAVVEAVCAVENIDPMDMSSETAFVLGDHIDPAALDSIFEDGTGGKDRVVTFHVTSQNSYMIDVTGDGRIYLHHGQAHQS